MITVIDDYFAKGCGRCERFATAECSTRRWQRGLAELRRICPETRVARIAKFRAKIIAGKGAMER